MHMMGAPIDYAILIVYFVGILAFGAYFARFTKSTQDFFFGGQRFSWWLIAASLVATGIGSYSFLKYAQTGFTSGLSSTMTYLNDWFMIPLFMFGWLPIIYFSRIKSIPEYFDRRFDRRTRLVATIFTLLYLVGYIGLNFYLMGLAIKSLMGVEMWIAIPIVAIISAIYVTTGGQTAVIFTDLIQGAFLYIAGAVLLIYGLTHIGGISEWWANLDVAHRLPFPGFNRPAEFEFTGIFWGEGIVGTLAFTFINQGFIMRYLAAKSVNEGRKTLTFNTLLLMPISAVVVGGIGWIAAAMVSKGQINTGVDAKDIFMIVSNIVTRPGIFGFVIAALTAALMSTIDTLINAVAAIGIFDIYKNYFKKEAPDKHYLKASRIVSIIATVVGLALVPVFAQSRSILQAHYTFVAIITPPMLVAIFLGVVWKRFTPKAAFWGMIIGGALILVSIFVPEIIVPIARTHGLTDGSEANIVFESVSGGPIMGPRAAYNWQEIFSEKDGAVSEYVVEYELKSSFKGDYTNSAPVYKKNETIDDVPVTRYCAPLSDLKPRDSYVFRVVNKETGAIYNAILNKGLDANKLPMIELVDSDALPKDAPGKVAKFGFKTAGDYGYFRSVFGLIVTLIACVAITFFTKPKMGIEGLTVDTILAAKRSFKGGEPNETKGGKVVLSPKIVEGEEALVRLPATAIEKLSAKPGDLLYIADKRFWLGGLRSNHIHLGEPHGEGDFIIISRKSFEDGNFIEGRPLEVEKII